MPILLIMFLEATHVVSIVSLTYMYVCMPCPGYSPGIGV